MTVRNPPFVQQLPQLGILLPNPLQLELHRLELLVQIGHSVDQRRGIRLLPQEPLPEKLPEDLPRRGPRRRIRGGHPPREVRLDGTPRLPVTWEGPVGAELFQDDGPFHTRRKVAERFDEDDAEGEDVGLVAVRAPLRLRRHVEVGPDVRRARRIAAAASAAFRVRREAHVPNLGHAVQDENVGRLNVAVDNAPGVQVRQSPHALPEQGPQPRVAPVIVVLLLLLFRRPPAAALRRSLAQSHLAVLHQYEEVLVQHALLPYGDGRRVDARRDALPVAIRAKVEGLKYRVDEAPVFEAHLPILIGGVAQVAHGMRMGRRRRRRRRRSPSSPRRDDRPERI
mmetsp:Transcript_33585/g.100108  ORF Transcript_33585/g.100108 Transcript_33585/m.100108 type:complete len:339 (-) Transcript_33585:778-1794(-)